MRLSDGSTHFDDMSTAQSTESIRVPLAALRIAAADVASLIDNGWIAKDEPASCRLIRSGLQNANDQLSRLDSLRSALVDVQVVGVRGGQELRLRRVNDQYEVVGLPEVIPARLFDDTDDQQLAEQAWERDAHAALQLPMSWTITADLALSRLVAAPSGTELRACLFSQSITEAVLAASLSNTSHFLPADGTRRIYLALLADTGTANLGAITLSGLPASPGPGAEDVLSVPAAQAALVGELEASERLPHGLPRANVMLPATATVPNEWWPAAARFASLAALSVWCMLASDCTVQRDAVHLVFVGFKRVELDLEAPGMLGPDSVSQTLRLRAWAFSDLSPDRLLAIRQVVSLYHGLEALDLAADILASAEIIYHGLRSDAVAEVVKSARDAQSEVLDAVRQSLRGAQDLAKSATERFLAALVGIASVLIANASKVLSNHVGRNLMLLVAGFLVVLTIFSLLVEGPLLSIPLRNLEADLRDSSALLTAEQLKRVTSIPSAESTRARIRAIRAIIPVTYVATSALIVIFGYPSDYK